MEKKDFYLLHSEMCKTLAHPKRQEILDNLRKDEMSVTDLAKTTAISQANLSQHLSLMRAKGIVRARRVGINVYYSIANTKIIQAFDLISEVLRESLLSQSETVKEATQK
jgi:ArsR family transcriptional regulator